MIPQAWLQEARAGNSAAMKMIGEDISRRATDLRQSERAAAWLTVSANLGDVPAMFDLDAIYMNANGMLYDLPRAYLWSGLAVRLSHGGPQLRRAVDDHKRAAMLLWPSRRPALDGQIRFWRPQRFALPNGWQPTVLCRSAPTIPSRVYPAVPERRRNPSLVAIGATTFPVDARRQRSRRWMCPTFATSGGPVETVATLDCAARVMF